MHRLLTIFRAYAISLNFACHITADWFNLMQIQFYLFVKTLASLKNVLVKNHLYRMRIYTCSTAVVYWYSLPNHWVQLVSDNSIFFKIVNISCKFVYLRSSYFSIIINDRLKFKKNKKNPNIFQPSSRALAKICPAWIGNFGERSRLLELCWTRFRWCVYG